MADLERSHAHYSALGFVINPAMSNHNGTCFIIEDGHSYLMVIAREFFQTFTERPIADPANGPWGALIVYLESKRPWGRGSSMAWLLVAKRRKRPRTTASCTSAS